MYPMRDKLVPAVLGDPTSVPKKFQAAIKAQLDTWFGTPRNPKVEAPSGGDVAIPDALKLDKATLAKGSALYRVHCLHCHGVNGDGRGVTARWVVPHPRDFRQGLFKFQSVDQTGGPLPPRREDLRRTLTHGVEATAMPAFNLLHAEQIEDLISYVVHLSIRGRVEYDTFNTSFDYESGKTAACNLDDYDKDDENTISPAITDQMTKLFAVTVKNWEKAQTKAIKMAPYPYKEGDEEALKASVQRGFHNFIGNVTKDAPLAKGLNCVSCHKNFGREATFRWDAWGTLVRPNNLIEGIHRGGRRTEDLYNRIHSGINGSGMPPFGGNETQDPRIVWDMVNFVRMLPYPAMREKYGLEVK
jgi:mono/diheme cytochrome c family protein